MHSQRQGDWIAFTKGAVDGLLQISDQVWVEDHIEPLTGEWVERIQDANNDMAQKGMRVLGVAFRWLDQAPETPTEAAVEQRPGLHRHVWHDRPRPSRSARCGRHSPVPPACAR